MNAARGGRFLDYGEEVSADAAGEGLHEAGDSVGCDGGVDGVAAALENAGADCRCQCVRGSDNAVARRDQGARAVEGEAVGAADHEDAAHAVGCPRMNSRAADEETCEEWRSLALLMSRLHHARSITATALTGVHVHTCLHVYAGEHTCDARAATVGRTCTGAGLANGYNAISMHQ